MVFVKKLLTHVLLLVIISAVLMGCARRASVEEMAQLEDLKAEVAALEREISSKEQEKTSLQQQVDQLDRDLQKCAEDKEAVRQRLQQWD